MNKSSNGIHIYNSLSVYLLFCMLSPYISLRRDIITPHIHMVNTNLKCYQVQTYNGPHQRKTALPYFRTFGLGLSNLDFRTWTFGLGLSDLDFRTWTFGLGPSDLDFRTWTFGLGLGLSDLDFRTWTFGLDNLDFWTWTFGLGFLDLDF